MYLENNTLLREIKEHLNKKKSKWKEDLNNVHRLEDLMFNDKLLKFNRNAKDLE